jgi:thiol:disulfide interchange protein
MNQAPRQERQSQKTDKAQSRRWTQIALIAAVALVAAAVLLLKNHVAGPPPLTLAEALATAGEGEQEAATAPVESSEEQLERLLATGQPTLAFFHSNNCVECIKMIKLVADVYPEFEDSVALVDANIYDPQNRALVQQINIHYIPTLIFYDASGEGKLIVGAIPRQRLRFLLRAAAGEE